MYHHQDVGVIIYSSDVTTYDESTPSIQTSTDLLIYPTTVSPYKRLSHKYNPFSIDILTGVKYSHVISEI